MVEIYDTIWIDSAAIAAVILLLPFYIGYVDSPLEVMLVYAVAGGLALAAADNLLTTSYAGAGLRNMLLDAGAYGAAVLVVGLIPFGLAIWLI